MRSRKIFCVRSVQALQCIQECSGSFVSIKKNWARVFRTTQRCFFTLEPQGLGRSKSYSRDLLERFCFSFAIARKQKLLRSHNAVLRVLRALVSALSCNILANTGRVRN